MHKDIKSETTIDDLCYCPICNEHFIEGDPVSGIRGANRNYLIVHKKCLNDKETRIEVEKLPKVEVALEGQIKLWRYMDLYKFISMMKNSSLFFSSPKCFDDPFEGAHGELDNKPKWDQFYSSFFRASLITAPDNCWHQVDNEKLEKDVTRLVNEISRRNRLPIFINCWHWNENESEAMWKLYSTSVENAVAIQTTYDSLLRALRGSVSIKPVRYIDFSVQFPDLNELYLYKRKSFEYEHEVRALFYDSRKKRKAGIERKVNLNTLIKEYTFLLIHLIGIWIL